MAYRLSKPPGHIREMFDQIAPRYDFLNHLLSLRTDVIWRRRAAALCEGAARILDVCSGTGDLAFELHRRWGSMVCGADFAVRMLERARDKAARSGVAERVRFQAADTMRLPFRSGVFDACTAAFGIRNVSDPARGIAEMARVVRPGGKVVILEFTLPTNPFMRRTYQIYFNHVLPRLGRMIARSEIDAYRYLPESVAAWPRPAELATIMERSGLQDVQFDLLFGGIAAIHHAVVKQRV